MAEKHYRITFDVYVAEGDLPKLKEAAQRAALTNGFSDIEEYDAAREGPRKDPVLYDILELWPDTHTTEFKEAGLVVGDMSGEEVLDEPFPGKIMFDLQEGE